MTTKTRREAAAVERTGVSLTSLMEVVGKAQSELTSIMKAARAAATTGQSATTALAVVRKATTSLQAVDGLKAALATYEAELAAKAEREFQELDASLRQACIQRGWNVEGHWPTLYIQRGVTVEIDAQKCSATIGTKRITPVDLSGLLNVLEEQVRRLGKL